MMPRQSRFLPPGNFYHIMARGNNRADIFSCVEDYQYYLMKFDEYKQDHPFDLYHYCLMPNHTHFLIQTKKALDFSSFMKKINLAYFHHFNREYGWTGHFWQDRYKSQAVGKDAYFIQCGKYIELNPVRAGIAESPESYHWSSYNFYARGETNKFLTPDIFYEEMGQDVKERMNNYQKLVINSSVINGLRQKDVLVIGTKQFIDNAKRKLNYHIEHKGAHYRQK